MEAPLCVEATPSPVIQVEALVTTQTQLTEIQQAIAIQTGLTHAEALAWVQACEPERLPHDARAPEEVFLW